MSRKPLYLIVCVLTSTVVCLSTTTQAQHQQKKPDSVASASALRAVIDKETGQLRAATAKELAQMLRQEQQTQKQTMDENREFARAAGQMNYNADGSMSMVLDPSQLETITATVNADGSVIMRHGDHVISPAKTKLAEQ